MRLKILGSVSSTKYIRVDSGAHIAQTLMDPTIFEFNNFPGIYSTFSIYLNKKISFYHVETCKYKHTSL